MVVSENSIDVRVANQKSCLFWFIAKRNGYLQEDFRHPIIL